VFALLLSVVGLAAAVSPEGFRGFGGVAITSVQSLALLLTLHNAGVRGRRLNFARFVALLPVLGLMTAALLGRPAGALYYVSSILLIVGTQWAIVVHAVGRGKITIDTVMGALCVYVLLGLLFATVDAFYASAVGPFFAQPGSHPGSDYVYFSFITLETVGYGDLSPVPGLPRVLSFAEGLLGQLYLVTVISLLVGNLGAERLARRSQGHAGAASEDGPAAGR
jgi:hypothetical protein